MSVFFEYRHVRKLQKKLGHIHAIQRGPKQVKRNPDLIFDIGMHIGEDTEFYLKKGFRVVAVEANPTLCREAKERFSEAIASGQLRIVEGCISDKTGQVEFFINNKVSEWSSFLEHLGSREVGSVKTLLPAISIADMFEEFGMPYYLKIDIEGADFIPIQGLANSPVRPVYVSFEAANVEPAAMLFNLGYKRFALARQRRVPETKLPNPQKEGIFVEHSFPLGSSGAFGAEINATWGSLEDCVREHVICKYLYRNIPGQQDDWAGIHAYNAEEAKLFAATKA